MQVQQSAELWGMALACIASNRTRGTTCHALLILVHWLSALATCLSARNGGPAVAEASVSVLTVAPAAAASQSECRHEDQGSAESRSLHNWCKKRTTKAMGT